MGRTTWLFLILGSLISFVWESYQMPFFEPGSLTSYQQTIRCGIASLGDGVILLAAHRLAVFIGGTDWWASSRKSAYFTYFGFGLAVAVLVELIATSLPPDSVFAWRYSRLMPIDPVLGLALVPIAMWVIVPGVTLVLVRFTTARTV